MLDAVARRYGTDPWTVLGWDPWRLSYNVHCMQVAADAASGRMRQIQNSGGMIFPTVVLHEGGF